MNDLKMLDSLRALAVARPMINRRHPAHANELLPYPLSDGSMFSLYEEQVDGFAVAELAKHHPFGAMKGSFEFVLRDETGTIGAVEIIIPDALSFQHHLQRAIFKNLSSDSTQHRISISRLYGPADLTDRRDIHRRLLKGITHVAPYLVSEPLALIECASYDYVPALLDEGFRLETDGRIYDAFYYWKPVFMSTADVPPVRSRRDMTAAYQSVKAKRNAKRHYAILVNDRYWYLISQQKFWCLKKNFENNGFWRSLRAGDIVFFLRGGRWLRGYGVVEDAFNNKTIGLEDYPLGIKFREVIECHEFDTSLEGAKTMGRSPIRSGLAEVSLEFSSYALKAIRAARGGTKMWVVPNPLLIAETDIEATSDEVFVVMPWGHRHSIYKIISEVCASAGYTSKYAAEASGQVLLEDIWQLLNRSRAVIVDFTSQRPNVYLEFGMAIVLGKPIIAITQRHEDCPSDVKNIKYILYTEEHAEHILKAELPRALRETIEQVERMAEKRNTNAW